MDIPDGKERNRLIVCSRHKAEAKGGGGKGEEDDNGNGSVVGIQGNCNYPTCSSHQDNSSDIKDDD